MSEYLKQMPSGHIYVATEKLKQRSDMQPCDPPGTVYKEPEPEQETQQGPGFGPGLEMEPESEETEPVSESDEGADTEMEQLQDLYRRTYGRPAPPKIKKETLKEKLGVEE